MEYKLKIKSDEYTDSRGKRIFTVEKNGRDYTCVRYSYPVEPSEALGIKARNAADKRFRDFVKERMKVNNALRTAGSRGLIYPAYEYIWDHHWIELFDIPGKALGHDEALAAVSSLELREKCDIIMKIVGAVGKLHEKGVLCGEFDPARMVMYKTKEGLHQTKLACDGYAFSQDNIEQECPPFSEKYQSPEMLYYRTGLAYGESRDKLREVLNKAAGENWQFSSDIFSLGLFMYWILTGGRLPYYEKGIPAQELFRKDKNGDPAQLRLDGAQIKNARLIALLSDMLQKRADHRPNIDQVYNRLRDISQPPLPQLHDGHDFTIDKSEFDKKAAYLSVTDITGADGKAMYLMIDINGVRRLVSADNLLTEGLVSGFDPPWSESEVLWDWEEIKKEGICAIERIQERDGSKRYRITSNNGRQKESSIEKLIKKHCAYTSGSTSEKVRDDEAAEDTSEKVHDEHPAADPSEKPEMELFDIMSRVAGHDEERIERTKDSVSRMDNIDYPIDGKVKIAKNGESHCCFEDHELWEEDKESFALNESEASRFIGRVLVVTRDGKELRKYEISGFPRPLLANELCTKKIFHRK